MPLTFLFVYRENAMFACSIGEYVITVQMSLTLWKSQTVINMEHNIITVDVSSINRTYLCIVWWRIRNTYNVVNKQYNLGFGWWSTTGIVTSGTWPDEQTRVFKIINEMPLTFVFIYRKNAVLACNIGEYVITVQMFWHYVRVRQ